jgi:hypothetical protein
VEDLAQPEADQEPAPGDPLERAGGPGARETHDERAIGVGQVVRGGIHLDQAADAVAVVEGQGQGHGATQAVPDQRGL